MLPGSKRSYAIEKLARIYDDELLPVWGEHFAKMILGSVAIPPKSTVLEVGCATGVVTCELAKRLDERSRLVAIDSAGALLDVARRKLAAQTGKQVFLRTESQLPQLSFTDGVYDVVVSNLAWAECAEPDKALGELVRVCRPGGGVWATVPLVGTWGEFYDIFRDVLVKGDDNHSLTRLNAHLAAWPDAPRVEAWAKSAGLIDVTVDVASFTLLFGSAREFFYAPVVEHGPLSAWKAIAGQGDAMHEAFAGVKESIETYFKMRAFAITVRAGCVSGRKPEP